MVTQALEDFGVLYLAVTDVVLAGPLGFSVLIFDFHELAGGNLTLRAALRRVFAFVHVTANHASEFLLHN
jgi:hypothetical protein